MNRRWWFALLAVCAVLVTVEVVASRVLGELDHAEAEADPWRY